MPGRYLLDVKWVLLRRRPDKRTRTPKPTLMMMMMTPSSTRIKKRRSLRSSMQMGLLRHQKYRAAHDLASIESYVDRFPRIDREHLAEKFPEPFKDQTVLKGDKLLEKGGRALGKALRYGAFASAETVDLGWNRIRYRGIASISKSFASGAGGSRVVFLNLQGNSLGDGSMAELGPALVSGLPALNRLDLSCNQIMNKGALALAHALFSGGAARLTYLSLRKNDIKDQGATGIVKAARAGQVSSGGYRRLDALVLRDNKITVGCLRSLNRATKTFLQV